MGVYTRTARAEWVMMPVIFAGVALVVVACGRAEELAEHSSAREAGVLKEGA